MKLRENLQRTFLAPIFGLVFAFFLCFVNQGTASAAPLDAPLNTTPTSVNSLTILADIDDEPLEEDTEETEPDEENSTEDSPETCYDQVKGIGWLVCPTTGVLAQAVDSIYKVIEDMLVVQPISSDSESPIYIVWQYVRDLTNIIFIILIIVVIYSHLTGVGFDNYNIKKILPKLIITAILINLSFIICSALVDTSNIIGASLRGFFENIESQVDASGDLVTWTDLASVLVGGGAVAGFAISAAGGVSAFIWMLIPAVISALLAIAVGLITIAMRQAVVALLIMIAPLAFVCYMLPNTNKWFSKWKDILASMLFFFPMFSALFGASHLAGWALIAKAEQDSSYFMLILGMAVQVVPLFLCVPMMKMSGSILGQISSRLSNIASGADNKVRTFSDEQRANARARKLAEASTRNFNPLSGASVAAAFQRRQAIRAEARARNETTIRDSNNLYVNARRTGRRIIGWSKNGTPIYATRSMRDENGKLVRDEHGVPLRVDAVKSNRDMAEEYRTREVKLASDADNQKTDNAMGNIDAYLRANQVNSKERHAKALRSMSKGQAQNYLNFRTQQSAKSRNDRSDQRFYFEQVRKASEADPDTGDILHNRLYHELVKAGAGADAYDLSKNSKTIRQNALTTVTADAYDAYEKERAVTSQRYSTLFDKQVTKNVLSQYKDAFRSMNIDAITAAQNTLAKRGDYDKVSENVRNFMDQTGDYADLTDDKRLRLGTDFANTLALNLLGMKNADPLLGRLGKSINMETWQATNGNRSTDVMTFKDYVFGNQFGGNNQARTSAFELLKGTSIKDADRTFFGDIRDTAKAYGLTEAQYSELIGNMMPQFISGIPTFESGGEQILNSMRILTGLKQNSKGRWEKADPSDTIHIDLVKKYVGGMTDKDLNSFKTDAFQAVLEAIAQSTIDTKTGQPMTCYGVAENGKVGFYPPQDVYAKFREMVKPSMLENIRNNLAQGTNTGMKEAVQIALGLAQPKAGERRKEN